MVNYRITYTPKNGRGYLKEIRRNPQKHPIKYPKQNTLASGGGGGVPEMYTYFDNSP